MLNLDIKIKVCVFIVDKNDNLLLIKEKSEKERRFLWNVVKGTYGDNQESILETAVRECKEETSTNVELINALRIYIYQKGSQARIQFNFLAKIKNGIPKVPQLKKQQRRNEIISEVKWFSKNKLLKMKSNEFISPKIYESIKDWILGRKYPLEIYKKIKL